MTMDQVASIVAFFFFLGGLIGWHIGHHRYAEMRENYRRSLELRMRASAEAREASHNAAMFRAELDTRVQRIIDQLESSIAADESKEENKDVSN